MTITFNYEMYTDHYGTTLWCEEYANKPHFNKFWRWGIDEKVCGEMLNNKPNMKKLMKRYLADGEVEMEKTSYKDTKSSFRGDAKIQKRTIMNSITESYKRLNENFNDIVSEVTNYILSNNSINGKTSLMTIDRLIRDAYFELYGEEMEMDNRDLYRAIRDEVMFGKHSLRESYNEDLDYEMGEFIKAAQKMRGTYSAKSSNGKLKVGDRVAYERPSGWYEGVISDFSYNPMTGEETVDVDYWNEAKKSKWTMIGLPMSKVKKI